MIYLYGLTDAPASVLAAHVASQQGLEGPVSIASVDRWQLAYSDHHTAEILPKRRLMLTHTRILERMIPLGTVLPARFGLIAKDVKTAGQLIAAQSNQVAAGFKRVAGCVELGVRISFERQAALEATIANDPDLQQTRDALLKKGPEAQSLIAAFGEALADRLDRRRMASQRHVLHTLLPLARDHVLRAPETDTEVLRAEFLLPTSHQQDFLSAVSKVAQELDFAPGAEPLIDAIGPAPMYHFVQLNLSADPKEQAA